MLTDYLIVGQGLAGSILALTLMERGKSVFVIAQPNLPTSSEVAAGLFNPVTGKRFAVTWKAEELFPYLWEFYPRMEQTLQAKFFYPKNTYRLLPSAEDGRYWGNKITEKLGHDYLKSQWPSRWPDIINNPFGGMEVGQSGHLDIPVFLKATREVLEKRSYFSADEFAYETINLSDGKVLYKSCNAANIIFCDGVYGAHNPYFSWLPFNPCKGQLLLIHAPQLPEEYILNQNLFILPVGNHHFKVGSTYEWDYTDPYPSSAGLEDLKKRLENILRVPYEILHHKAGLRPTVKNRRPLIGQHPQWKQVWIFNGMGTKGVSQAPWLAHHFCEHLQNNSALDEEVNISRFYSLCP